MTARVITSERTWTPPWGSALPPPVLKRLTTADLTEEWNTADKEEEKEEATCCSVMGWTPPWGSALPPPVQKRLTTADFTEEWNTEDEEGPRCPVCLQVEAVKLVTFCHCKQKVCVDCQTRWFQQKPASPSCPVCLEAVPRDELLQTLGITAERIPPVAATSEVEMDELTRHWLEMEGAKMCPDCGIWICKEGGCCHMTCAVCGFEFCWYCLIQIGECEEEHEEEDEDEIEEEGQ